MKAAERASLWKARCEVHAKEANQAKRFLRAANNQIASLEKQLAKQQGDFCLGVRPISAEIGRYEVRSRSDRSSTHLVDLLARNGLGECSCDFWKFEARVNSDIRKTQLGKRYRPIPYGYEGACLCAHLQAARSRFSEMLIQRLAEEQGADDWSW